MSNPYMCRSCGQPFNSESAFDKHRIGAYPDRRCRTSDEMQDAGMAVNAAGRWCTALMPTDRTYAPQLTNKVTK